MALSQQDIIAQLDRLKTANRNYMRPKEYTEFLPQGIPGLRLPDTSALGANVSAIGGVSNAATKISMVQAQNERDYQQMLAAQTALQQAQKGLKQATKKSTKSITAPYQGGGIGNLKNVPQNSGGQALNVPPGKFKDPTPFSIGSGLGNYKWKGFNLTLNKSIADNFIGFLNSLAKSGYQINSIGSYSNRNIAGTNTKSLHSYGLAIDINPGNNPVTWNGKNVTDLPANVGRLAAKYGLTWGGNWNGTKKDTMHFSKPWFGTK